MIELVLSVGFTVWFWGTTAGIIQPLPHVDTPAQQEEIIYDKDSTD
jgi:hypothetical protein